MNINNIIFCFFFRKMIKIQFILFLFILIMGIFGQTIEHCPNVYAVEGKIKIEPFQECEIEANEIIFNGTDKEIPGYWYGFINFKCGNCSGSIISNFNCIDCGIYCVRNDMNIKCRSFWFPSFCGIFFGIIALGIIYYCYIKINKFLQPICLSKMEKIRENKRNRKLKSLKNKLERIKLHDTIIDFNESNIEEEIELNEVKIKSNIEDVDEFELLDAIVTLRGFTNDEEFKLLDSYSSKENVKSIINDNEALLNKMKTMKDNKNLSPKILAAISILFLLINPIQACANALFLSAEGRLCDDKECKSITSHLFTMTLNQQICFKLDNEELLKIQFIDSQFEMEYYPIYKTSLVIVDTERKWDCKRANSDCWFEGACYPNSRHKSFETTEWVEDYGCFVDTLGCETWCWHQTSCTWMQWFLKENSSYSYVYKKSRSYWRITLQISYQNLTKRINFSTNKIDNIVDSSKFFGINELPITITSYISEDNLSEQFLLGTSDRFFEVKASEVNFPKIGEIGEYQVSLDGKTRIYPEQSVSCQSISCKPKCKIPKQALKRFLDETPKITTEFNFAKIKTFDEKKVIVEQQNYASINLLLGNVKIANLHIAPASCKVELVGKFGCTGCKENPYIVLKSSEIKENGIMLFQSNCSFIEKTIACGAELQKLRLEYRMDNCYIHIPNINKTIFFAIEYEFLGGLTRYNSEYSADDQKIVDTAMGLITNFNFLESIKFTFIFGTAMAAIVSFVTKVFRYYFISKQVRKIEKD